MNVFLDTPEIWVESQFEEELHELNATLFCRLAQMCVSPYHVDHLWLGTEIIGLLEQMEACCPTEQSMHRVLTSLLCLEVEDSYSYIDERDSHLMRLFRDAMLEFGLSVNDEEFDALFTEYKGFISNFYADIILGIDSMQALTTMISDCNRNLELPNDVALKMQPICDMAVGLDDYGDDCENLFKPTFVHLAKICIFPEELERNYFHWRDEIVGFIMSLFKQPLKTNKSHKKLLEVFKRCFIMNMLGENFEKYDNYKYLFVKTVRDENKSMSNKDITNLMDENRWRFERFFNGLMSIKSIPSKEEIVNLIYFFAYEH